MVVRAVHASLDAREGPEPRGIEEALEATRPLIVPARALVVSRKDTWLGGLTTALSEYGVSAYVVAPEGSGVFDALGRDPRVSVLVVRVGELGSVHRRVLQKLAFDRPSLHIVAVGATEAVGRALSEFPNVLVFSLVHKPLHVAGGVARRLNGHFFDRQILDAFPAMIQGVLRDADIELTPLPPLLRVGATVLGDLSAMTIIGGHDLNGRVTVSAPSVFFERLSLAWRGRPLSNREDVWDCAGELCNRLTGVVRTHYLERGLESRQSIATIIEGRGVSVRCMTTMPGLVIPLELERLADPIYAELVLASKAEDRDPDADERTSMNTGELTFL